VARAAMIAAVLLATAGCRSTLEDFSPLALHFTGQPLNEGNPRYWTLSLADRGECRPFDGWLEVGGSQRRPVMVDRCAPPSWELATGPDFKLTDGHTSATFTVTQIEPVIGGSQLQVHPSAPQYVRAGSGDRVSLDMNAPVECLPADFAEQLAANQIERAADGTLSVLARGALRLRFQALCVTRCEGATCSVDRPEDDFVVGFITP
jgi:hypothetical protein